MSPSCIRNNAAKVCCNNSSVGTMGDEAVVVEVDDDTFVLALACEVELDEEPDTNDDDEEEEGWDLDNARRKSGHV